MHAVIMTGGRGTRLAPYTNVLPKGLLPMGGNPILETIVRQLRIHGFTRITMACGYLGTLIQTYFGDGSRFGVNIDYVVERQALGTVGALPLVSNLPKTFLVMNCDVLTTLHFGDFVQFHKDRDSVLTIASQRRNVPMRLGVLGVNQDRVVEFIEKPSNEVCASMGMYIMNRDVIDWIPDATYFDVPDLIQLLLKENFPVCHYENTAYWSDVGTYDDYLKTSAEFDALEPLLFAGDQV